MEILVSCFKGPEHLCIHQLSLMTDEILQEHLHLQEYFHESHFQSQTKMVVFLYCSVLSLFAVGGFIWLLSTNQELATID